MGDDSPIISSAYPVVLKPVFAKVNNSFKDNGSPSRKQRESAAAVQDAFAKVESTHPGWAHDFLLQLISATEVPVVLNESVLRLGGSVEIDSQKINRSEQVFQDLNKRSSSLKRILSRIPDEIGDRKVFLETIKEIAGAIKKLLDCVHEISESITDLPSRQVLDQRKKEFVKYSKRFSNTLKDFFKDGQAAAVFYSANCLINQTNLILQTVKEKCG